jgi:hypothetical protein
MRLAGGEAPRRRDVIPTIPMTPQMLTRFYPKVGGAWTPDFQAIAALSAREACTRE